MLGYFCLDIICFSQLTVFLVLNALGKPFRFMEQIMSAEKYPTIFSRQTKAIVYTFLSLISIDLVIKKLQENKKVKHIRKYDKHSMESLNSNFWCTDWRKCENNEDPNVCYSSRYKKTY